MKPHMKAMLEGVPLAFLEVKEEKESYNNGFPVKQLSSATDSSVGKGQLTFAVEH